MDIKNILKIDYGLIVTDIRQMNAGVVNDNFYIKTNSGEFVLKNYKSDNIEKVKFEIELYHILEKNNFPAPRLVKNLKGDFHGLGDNIYVLFHYIPGIMLQKIDSHKAEIIGGLLGKMHFIFQDFQMKIVVQTWEKDDILDMIVKHGDKVELKDFYQAKEFVSFIKNEFNKLNLNIDLPCGMTHQDVKPDNVIESSAAKLSLIDFNNCYNGVLLYDVMTFAIWALFEDDKLNFEYFISYLKAYDSQRKFSDIEKKYIIEALKFRLLREAYVWPFRWLNAEKARKYSWMFVSRYKDIINNENSYKQKLEKIWQN